MAVIKGDYDNLANGPHENRAAIADVAIKTEKQIVVFTASEKAACSSNATL